MRGFLLAKEKAISGVATVPIAKETETWYNNANHLRWLSERQSKDGFDCSFSIRVKLKSGKRWFLGQMYRLRVLFHGIVTVYIKL